MRPVHQRLSANGFSPWVVLDRYVRGFTVGLGVQFSSDADLVAGVEHCFDNILRPTPLDGDLSRSTTVLTVPINNHGLRTTDGYVSLKGFGAPFDGDYDVASVVDQNNVTVTVVNSGPTSAARQNGICVIARYIPHVVLTALAPSANGYDGNYVSPPVACRMRVSSYVAGYVDLDVIQGGR